MFPFSVLDLSDNKISGSGSAVLILNSRNIILSLLQQPADHDP
nr:MAG TPA_asm: hypothetical protein [Caudoviricetes sp.]